MCHNWIADNLFAVVAVADIGSAAAVAVVVAGTAVLEGKSAAHLAFYSGQSFAHSQTADNRKAAVVTLNRPQDLGCYPFGKSYLYSMPAVAVADLFDTVGAVVEAAAAAAAAVIETEELRRGPSPWPPQGDHPMDFH